MSEYYLMHKRIKVCKFSTEGGNITAASEIIAPEHMPISTFSENGLELQKLAIWYKLRGIPASRRNLDRTLEQVGIDSVDDLIHKGYGLSLSDHYWYCPCDEELEWGDINFFDNDFSDDLGKFLVGEETELTTDELNMNSPNGVVNGNMMECWRIIDGRRCFVKRVGPSFQEAHNEIAGNMFADVLCSKYITYDTLTTRGNLHSICENAIDKDTELIPAGLVMLSKHNKSVEFSISEYISICKEHGLQHANTELSKLIALDCIINNTDRHWSNFGILRNPDTLEWTGFMPIFDNGNSLWYDIYSDDDVGCDQKDRMTGKMLSEHVNDIIYGGFIDITRLHETADEVSQMLSGNKRLTPNRIDMINKGLHDNIDRLDARYKKMMSNRQNNLERLKTEKGLSTEDMKQLKDALEKRDGEGAAK